MNDSLTPFIHQLGAKLLVVGVVCTVAGTVLGLVVKWGGEALGRGIGGLFRPASPRRRKDSTEKPSPDAPHCPECNRVMIRRKARRGASAGTEFWGCVQFPRCRGTRAIPPTN